MPLYICAPNARTIPDSAKPAIAEKITDVHCELTAAPRTFVHVFFFDEDKIPMLQSLWSGGDSTAPFQLFGNIRSGRTDDTKQQLIAQMCAGVAEILGVDGDQVSMGTRDVEAKWVMEGGDLLPEPGEEEAWLERHNQKMAAAAAAKAAAD